MADLDQELDRLFALPRDEFTAARNALASRLKKAGEADSAAEVKSLGKPTVAAAALNRLARDEPRAVHKLLEAAARLREAQAGAISGEGADALRKATAGEREVVRELVAAVRRREDLSPSILDRVSNTLIAAALDEDAGQLLARGRLTRELEAAAFPVPGSLGQPPPRHAGAGRAEKTRKREDERRQRADLQARLHELKRELSEARRETRRLERQAAQARAEADARERSLAEASEHEERLSADLDALAAQIS